MAGARDDPPVKKTLTKVVFSLTPQGIHCQGELQLIFVHRPKIIRPLSVLIPQKVPVGAIVTGQAELADRKIIGVKKALLLVKLDWRLFEEKLLLVKGAPVKEGEAFFLQRLQGQKAEKWGGTFHLKLPEKAKLIEEVTVIGVQGWTVKDEKGLLCMGRIDLELLYINHQDQEKAYRLQIPWEEWFAAAHFQETVDRHSETVSHHLKVEEVKTELIRFTNGDELTLFLHLAYLVRVTQRQKVSLPLPLHPRRTATILAKKIISEEKIEYYVEIPLTTPADFSENHRLWWRRGSERGDTVNAGNHSHPTNNYLAVSESGPPKQSGGAETGLKLVPFLTGSLPWTTGMCKDGSHRFATTKRQPRFLFNPIVIEWLVSGYHRRSTPC